MKPVLLALLLISSAASAQPQTEPGSIEGTVVHAGTSEAFPGVPIRLNAQITTTDARGHFTFGGIAPGQYRLMAGPDYVGTSQAITLASGQHIQGAVFSMALGGSVNGRILDPNGRPRAGLTVNLAEWAYSDGQSVLNAKGSAMTDDQGGYRMAGLFPGEYIVISERTYFPGTADRTQAKPVVVAAEKEASGIDFRIQPQPSARISGRILVPDPTVSANVSTLLLIPRDTGTPTYAALDRFNNVASATDRNEGAFEIWSVPPGLYDLFVQLPGNRGDSYSGRIEVRVGTEDVSNVMLTATSGGILSGRITMSGDTQIPSTPVQVVFRGKDVAASIPTVIARIAPDRSTFTAANMVAGGYRVIVSGMPVDAYLADILQDGRSVFTNGVVTVSGDTSPPVEIVIGRNGGLLDGKVQTISGSNAARAVVSLVPVIRENVALYKRATADESGHFTFRTVTPGNYMLYAWERIGTDLAEQSAQFLSTYEAKGQPVSVHAGGHITDIPLKLISR